MMLLPPDEQTNALRVEEQARALIQRAAGRPVFLVDGDRTLCPEDTSRIFLRRAGLDPLPIKQRFQQEGYCYSAFRHHAEVHLSLAPDVFERLATEVGLESQIYPGSAEFLRRARARALVLLVSAGIPRIWRTILSREGLVDIPVVGGIDPDSPYVFGRAEKGLLCRLFLKAGCRVIAIGDSDVDAEMMQLAHQAVVVINHNQNTDLLPHLCAHPALFQVVPRGQAHPEIRELSFETLHMLASESADALK